MTAIYLISMMLNLLFLRISTSLDKNEVVPLFFVSFVPFINSVWAIILGILIIDNTQLLPKANSKICNFVYKITNYEQYLER